MTDLQEITAILEDMEDQQLAATYLKQLTELAREHHEMIANQDPKLSHQEWEKESQKRGQALDKLIQEIKTLN